MKHELLIRCLQPPAPARHRLSQGIKLCCITWVWSAEANHPIHAWCNAILRRNMNILWTNMHYLRRISFAFVAGEHRRHTDGGSFRSILNSLYEKRGGGKMQSDIRWPFSKQEDWQWPGMNLLCPTSAPLSVQPWRGTAEKREGKIKK